MAREGRAPMATARMVGVVALLALAVRVAFLLTGAPDEEGQLGITDPLYYHAQANFLADGHWFIEPFAYSFSGRLQASATHPPLYTLVLAAGSALGGTSLFAHQVLSCLIGVAAAVVIALVARRLAGDRAGLLAGGLAAVYPQFWLNDATMRAETLFALLIGLVLLLAHRSWDRLTLAGAAGLGLVVGLAALTRGEALLLLPLLVLPLALRQRPSPLLRRLALVGVAGAVAAVVIAPWIVRNLRAFEEPVLLSNNVGEVIGGANCEEAYTGPTTGGWFIGCLDRLDLTGDESERASQARRGGTEYALDHKRQLPRVVALRVARLWDVYQPLENAEGNANEGRSVAIAKLALGVYYAVVPFALAGAVLLVRRRVPLLPVAALAAMVTLTAVVSWGAVRFRIPAEVAMVVLAGVALDALLGSARRRVAPGRHERGRRRPVAPT